MYRKHAADGARKARYETLHRRVSPIYGSTSRVAVDSASKASEAVPTFPDIYFTLHDHDMHDASNPPLARADECECEGPPP